MTDTATDFLTTKQVTERYPVSDVFLWRVRRDGKLPFYRVAGKVLFKIGDLETYFEGCRQNGTGKHGRSNQALAA